MKKLIIAVAAILLTAGVAKAETIHLGESLKQLPALKQGVAFSLIDNKINYLMTTDIIHIGTHFNIEAGYAGDAENTGHKAVIVASMNLLNMGGIDFPILKYVQFNPGVYAGLGNINFKEMTDAELDWGVSATVFQIKF